MATDAVLISADEAVAALTAAAWTEPIREEAYEKAVATVRTMAECARDEDRTIPPSDVLAAIERDLGTPRTLIHCFLGSMGADWDLDGAVQLVREAEKVGWAKSMFRHELAALKDGKIYRFDVRAPQAVTEPAS